MSAALMVTDFIPMCAAFQVASPAVSLEMRSHLTADAGMLSVTSTPWW